MASDETPKGGRWGLAHLFRNRSSDEERSGPSRWSMGVLNDKETVEVPGSVLLLARDRNEPLGLRHVHARTSHSSIPAGFPVETPMTPGGTRPLPTTPPATHLQVDENEDKKKTQDGKIILDPQPEDSANDPLNWPAWRRDVALLSLGFYCMIGGGITPLIAAGFTNVAQDYGVSVESVALTTGLYMMGMGLGSVIASPTAILFGKRPVYLMGVILLIGTSLWAGYSPSFPSLLAARVFQGVAVSPVECLPSATIAEIFFLHERAYRIGIYTLLLLGGKNLVPLVSAAIIGRFGWRWVFWTVAMVVGFGFVLLFLFVPETFWDRTPTRRPSRRPSFLRRISLSSHYGHGVPPQKPTTPTTPSTKIEERPNSPGVAERQKHLHVGFAPTVESVHTLEKPSIVQKDAEINKGSEVAIEKAIAHESRNFQVGFVESASGATKEAETQREATHQQSHISSSLDPSAAGNGVSFVQLLNDAQSVSSPRASIASPRHSVPPANGTHASISPYNQSAADSNANGDYFSRRPNFDNEKMPASSLVAPPKIHAYTHNLRQLPAQTFIQQLKPYHGRLNHDNWFKVMLRPFILFAYPAVLWSAVIYSCSIGWLIVISETLAVIYRNPEGYNFTALQTGLVYISPFVGGILGTGVAGKISDILVRAMARRNGGLYEPEFRLIMAAPILVATCIGLMGFGWSVQEKDHWIVPTIFFGIVSFGCSLGSTTSITFCVDSYRQYAGEALVTLNFSKNVFHGMVFSLFVSRWLADDGPKTVYVWLGIIQLIFCLFSIPMYIFGKRARMWTVRMNLMERF